MKYIEPNAVDWRQLFDDDKPIGVMFRRNEATDVVFGYLSMISNRGNFAIETFEGTQFGFHDYEVEKVVLLEVAEDRFSVVI